MTNKITIAQNSNRGARPKKNLFSTLVVLAAVLLICSILVQNLNRRGDVANEVDTRKTEVAKLKEEQDRLKQALSEAHTEAYIEKQLRDNLRLEKEGEITVVLPEESIVKKLAPKLKRDEAILPEPNWKRWLNLFL